MPLGECLADQLMLPLALAGGGSYRTVPLSSHSQNNAELIQLFLPVRSNAREQDPGVWLVEVTES